MPNDIHEPTALIIAAILTILAIYLELRERKQRRDAHHLQRD